MDYTIIIDWTRLIYYNFWKITLISSYYEDSHFFRISLALWIVEKTIEIFIMSKLKDCRAKLNNIFKYFYYSILDLTLHRNSKLNFASYQTIVFSYIFIFLQHLLLLIYLFCNQIINLPDSNYSTSIKIIQMMLGLVLFSEGYLYSLISASNLDFSFVTFLQLISLISGIVSLQGLGFLCSMDIRCLISLIIWKILSLICEIQFIKNSHCQLFGWDGFRVDQTAMVASALKIFNICVDYAPFYNQKHLKSNNFIFKQLCTQTYLIIIRGGQFIEVIVMFILLKQYDMLDLQHTAFTLYKRIVFICIIIFGILSIYQTLNKLYSAITHNYSYYNSDSLSLQQLNSLLKNSQNIKYLIVFNVQGIDSLLKSQSDNKKTKKMKDELFSYLLRLVQSNVGCFNIKDLFITQINVYILQKNLLIEQYLRMIEDINELPMNFIICEKEKLNEFQFQQAFINRLFKKGINQSNYEFCRQQQNLTLQRTPIQWLLKFNSDIIKAICFKNIISLQLNTNPSQVLFDLYDY